MGEPSWRRYLRFWGRDVRADVDDELRFHLDMSTQESVEEGMQPDEARAEAIRRFGDLARVRETCRRIGDRRQRHMHTADQLATLRQDAEYALRQLVRSPTFTVTAVLTLALGIGANSSIFSLIDAVLLRPLPGIREPDQLVEMTSFGISYPAYRDFRDASRGVLDLAAFRPRPMALRVGDRTELVTGGLVSGNFFTVLGASATHGRTLGEGDDSSESPAAAVVSHRFWRRSLAGDPHVLGRTVSLNGGRVTIVGVLERDFRGTRLVGVPDIWIPINAWSGVAPSSFAHLSIEQRGWSWLSTVGRLAPGATPQQAQSVLALASDRQYALHPTETERRSNLRIESAVTRTLGGGTMHASVRALLIMLGGVVTLVLLIACANIANLLLARASRRRREIGVRLALGASRGRLVRQLITEALILALIGGAVGLLGAWLFIGLLGRVTLGDQISLGALELGVDGRALTFTFGLAVITGLVFGLAPAIQASRPDAVSALKDGSRSDRRQRLRLRDTLLVTQVAMSLVLLIGAGLFVRSLQHALATDLGFRADGVALAAVDPGLVQLDPDRAYGYYEEVDRRIAAIPGVVSVTRATTVPLSGDENFESARIEGYVAGADERIALPLNYVGHDYLRTLQIPLVRGRPFEVRDTRASPKVAIVNETLAERYWAGQDPVGRRLFMSTDTITIIGVARTTRYVELGETPQPHVYLLFAQHPDSWLSRTALLVRTAGDPERHLGIIRRELTAAAPEVPVVSLGTFGDQLNALLLPQRAAATLLGAFGILALLVAAVGIYGVVAYGVSRRTREIGIRMALGARPMGVLGLVMGEGLTRVATGVLIGLALALASSRIAETLLLGVSRTDPLAFAGASLILLAVAAVATLVPARRATAIDPSSALRSE